jgi:hypothetical protein
MTRSAGPPGQEAGLREAFGVAGRAGQPGLSAPDAALAI